MVYDCCYLFETFNGVAINVLFFQVNGNLTVDGIDFFVTDTFGEGLYNSCKDVKFGTMNTRALDFVGAGARNAKGDFCFQFTALSQFILPHICMHS